MLHVTHAQGPLGDGSVTACGAALQESLHFPFTGQHHLRLSGPGERVYAVQAVDPQPLRPAEIRIQLFRQPVIHPLRVAVMQIPFPEFIVLIASRPNLGIEPRRLLPDAVGVPEAGFYVLQDGGSPREHLVHPGYVQHAFTGQGHLAAAFRAGPGQIQPLFVAKLRRFRLQAGIAAVPAGDGLLKVSDSLPVAFLIQVQHGIDAVVLHLQIPVPRPVWLPGPQQLQHGLIAAHHGLQIPEIFHGSVMALQMVQQRLRVHAVGLLEGDAFPGGRQAILAGLPGRVIIIFIAFMPNQFHNRIPSFSS